MDSINLHDPQSIITAVIALASLLANIVPAHTIVGKILHFLALNFRSGSLAQKKIVAAGSGESGGGA